MRVLVCTDDRTFSISLADAYRARGDDVTMGLAPLYELDRPFDLIHLHWPEELLGWHLPASSTVIGTVLAALDARRATSRLVCTVHNLLPHTMPKGDASTPAFYQAFYERMEVIGHFHRSSLDAVHSRFPAIARERHRVQGMNLFDNLRVHARGRAVARAALGIADDAVLAITLGTLRFRAERSLTMAAFGALDDRAVKLLWASRLAKGGNRARRWLEDRRFDFWARRMRVDVRADRQSEPDMVALLEAADMVLLPRLPGQLNSGLLPLAMTFGTPLVAPDFGVFRELLGATPNALYRPADAGAMARAMAELSSRTTATRAANVQMAAGWGWPAALDRLLSTEAAPLPDQRAFEEPI